MEQLIKEYEYQDFTRRFTENNRIISKNVDNYSYDNIEDFSEADPKKSVSSGEDLLHAEEILKEKAEEAEKIIRDAEERAAYVLRDAMDRAEETKNSAFVEAGNIANEAHKNGYDEGFEKGLAEGKKKAYDEANAELEERNQELLNEMKSAITELDRQKTDYIRMYNEDMKDLVIAIAEKVINVSLNSSGEIIRRMILNAVEHNHDKEWAKIFISESDASVMVHEDSDILDALKGVSNNIKIEVMENGEQGDLLIEYPDKVIDAGVKTQLSNIRQMMNDDTNS